MMRRVTVAMRVQQIVGPQQARQGAGYGGLRQHAPQVRRLGQDVVAGICVAGEQLADLSVQPGVEVDPEVGVDGDVSVAQEGLHLAVVK